jgi:hypothetical protein
MACGVVCVVACVAVCEEDEDALASLDRIADGNGKRIGDEGVETTDAEVACVLEEALASDPAATAGSVNGLGELHHDGTYDCAQEGESHGSLYEPECVIRRIPSCDDCGAAWDWGRWTGEGMSVAIGGGGMLPTVS